MEYDELVHSKDIQILKTMLPFIDSRQQLPLAIIIQSIEFKNTMQIFKDGNGTLSASAIENEGDRRTAMIQALLKQISPEEQESINNMMNMINMMSMMENIDNFQ